MNGLQKSSTIWMCRDMQCSSRVHYHDLFRMILEVVTAQLVQPNSYLVEYWEQQKLCFSALSSGVDHRRQGVQAMEMSSYRAPLAFY